MGWAVPVQIEIGIAIGFDAPVNSISIAISISMPRCRKPPSFMENGNWGCLKKPFITLKTGAIMPKSANCGMAVF